MSKLTAIALLASVTIASRVNADPKPLEVTVYTATPGGFLVDSTLVSGDKEAVLIDAQLTLSDVRCSRCRG